MVKFIDQLTEEEKGQAVKEIEDSISCDECGHFVSMHDDFDVCHSCKMDGRRCGDLVK